MSKPNDHSAANYDAAQPDPRNPKLGRPPKNGESATGHIHIRTTLHRKSAYVRAAKDKPLAEWMTAACDKDAAYEPPQSVLRCLTRLALVALAMAGVTVWAWVTVWVMMDL
jgi:hypothetical protein